ncbi:twin-arginine translocase TatA/TatE family subunit [candidate division KSB1 bacterium]|nr:twin-arginine translocase TatA/TatE family subunit [candidate division KSB1 bacterium]
MPGHMEIIVIVLIVLLLFGGKKIPELARGLGKGIREFKDGMKQVEEGMTDEDDKEEIKNEKKKKD